MILITFLPKSKTMASPVTYYVNEFNGVIAAYKAKLVFMQEHPFRYYDKIDITQARVL